METILIILAGVIIALIALTLISAMIRDHSLRTYVARIFGTTPDNGLNKETYDFVKTYYQLSKSEATLDDITWNDLDMDRLFTQINHSLSSVGDETLYAHLRNQKDFDSEALTRLSNQMSEDPALREKVQISLARLGRNPDNGLIAFIYSEDEALPEQFKFVKYQAILAWVPLILIFIAPALGLALFAFMFIINMITYYGLNKAVIARLRALNYFVDVLKAGRQLEKDLQTPIKGLSQFKQIRSYLSSLSVAPMDGTGFAPMLLFVNAYFSLYGLSFMKLRNAVKNNADAAERIYQAVGMIDVAYTRASLMHYVDYCEPEFSQVEAPIVTEMVHPLLAKPVPNSATLSKNMLVTGSNASGKSTFVRSLAINVILGQRLNFCYAKAMTYRKSFVATSMAISDDVTSGDSYFVAEVKSLKRLLEAVDTYDYSLLIIDEILKGTNTIERIAASASILNQLKSKPCFVCAATHDIELVSILAKPFTNIHFRELIDESGLHFDYKLQQGPSNTRNAIQLLNYYDYEPGIVDLANSLADDFSTSKQWQSLN